MTRSGLDREADSHCRPALKFHSIHGQNIVREASGCRVVRKTSFCNGIVFSNRPISIDERVGIRQTTLSANWSGVLRFGVTTIDPGLHRSLELPRFACPFLSEQPGYWIRALPDRYAKQGSLVQFVVTRGGDVMYGIDGASKGIFLRGIDTSRALWVVVDVYGTAKAVEFESSVGTPPRAESEEPALHSIERQFASRVRVHSPPVSLDALPVRAPRSAFASVVDRALALMGGGAATAGRGRADASLPPPPRVAAPETPLARPRQALVMSPPRERSSARIFGSSSRSELRPPERTTSLVRRQTPSATRETMTAAARPSATSSDGRTASSSTGRGLVAVTTGVRVLETTSSSRDEGPVYRRIEHFSETAMRLVRDVRDTVMESAVEHLSPGRAAAQPTAATRTASSSRTASRSPPIGTQTASSSRTASRTPPIGTQTTSSSTAARRTPPPPSAFPSSVVRRVERPMPGDGYLRLQPSSSSSSASTARGQRAAARGERAAVADQNQTTSSTSTRVSPRTAATAQHQTRPSSSARSPPSAAAAAAANGQAQTTSASTRSDAARRRSPLAEAAVQNRTASSAVARRSSVQKQQPSSASSPSTSRESDCSICMEASVNAVIYTCGHMCMCYDCALKIKVNSGICPLCRQPIKDVIRTFKA